MLPLIFSILQGRSEVVALVGDRIYRHGSAPQNVARPYVTWSAPGGFAENAFDGASADVFRIQIDCWSEDDAQIEAVAVVVRNAIEPHAHLIAYIADERDFETRRFRIGMAFDFIKHR